MYSEEVIQAVLENRPKEGWFVYRYQFKWGILGLFFRLFYLVIFGGATWTFWAYDSSQTALIIFAGVTAIISLLFFANHLVTIMFAGKSMVVLTEKGIVRNFRGKLYECEYSKIKDLKITRVSGGSGSTMFLPSQYVTFIDENTGQIIEIAKNRTFGLASNIYSSLHSKLIS